MTGAHPTRLWSVSRAVGADTKKGHSTVRKRIYLLGLIVPVVVALIAAGVVAATILPARGAHASAICKPTGYIRDGINMTAATINPTKAVTGKINAAGCNIGVYYGAGHTGTVNGAEIYGANYFGVVNDGGTVTVKNSRIHDIGENPFNGDQHGVGIYFTYGSGAHGTIAHNLIWYFQKNGIAVTGTGDSATINQNTVIGNGPVDYIAQNGIELGGGATGTITGNLVSGVSYTGSNLASSGGILVFGGDCYGTPLSSNITITKNVVIGSDVGLYISQGDGVASNPEYCTPPASTTNISASRNILDNDAITNTSGYGVAGQGYQAGISDQGNGDTLSANNICGVGYSTNATPPPYIYSIDDTLTSGITESGNLTCTGNAAPTSHSIRTGVASGHASTRAARKASFFM